MATNTSATSDHRPQRARFRPGHLVSTRTGYPTLYEVICVHEDGLLRVRGLNWAPGYSALIDAETVRPVTGALR